MSVTQKDIARALNVSLITVHRALTGTGYVSKSLRKKIFAYAEKVNYVPHRASQTLVRKGTRRIAIFSSTLPHYFWNDINTGVSVGAEQILPFKYEVDYHRIAEHDSDAYLGAVERELESGAGAVAFVHQWMYDMSSIISCLEKSGIPYITLNVDAPQSNRVCYVGPDYRAGGRLAAEFIGKTLIFRKKPRVLVINTKVDLPKGSDAPDLNGLRESGFLATMSERFPETRVDVGYVERGTARKSLNGQLEELLRTKSNAFDAVYLIPAYNSEFLPALKELSSEPVTTVVHDMDPSSVHYLKTGLLGGIIYQNPILQGYYAVKLLENLLELGHPPDLERITIEHSLVLEENRDLFRNHYLFTKLVDKQDALAGMARRVERVREGKKKRS